MEMRVQWQCPKCNTHLIGAGTCPICADRERQRPKVDLWAKKREDREWEMAGLARQDGDRAAERMHTERARAIARGEL